MNLSKSSDAKKHSEILINQSLNKTNDGLNIDDYTLASTAIILTDNDIIRDHRNIFYVFQDPYWKQDKYHEVRVCICNKLRNHYTEMSNHYASQRDFHMEIIENQNLLSINNEVV